MNGVAVCDSGHVGSVCSLGRFVCHWRQQTGRYEYGWYDNGRWKIIDANSTDFVVCNEACMKAFPANMGAPTVLATALSKPTCLAVQNLDIVVGDRAGRMTVYKWSQRISAGAALPLSEIIEVHLDPSGRMAALDCSGATDIYNLAGPQQSVDRVANGDWPRGVPTSMCFVPGGVVVGTGSGHIVWLGTDVLRPARTAPKAAKLVTLAGIEVVSYQVACISGHGEFRVLKANDADGVYALVSLGGGAVAALVGSKLAVVAASGETTELSAAKLDEFTCIAASLKAGVLVAGGVSGCVYIWPIARGSPLGELLHGGN